MGELLENGGDPKRLTGVGMGEGLRAKASAAERFGAEAEVELRSVVLAQDRSKVVRSDVQWCTSGRPSRRHDPLLKSVAVEREDGLLGRFESSE